MKLESIYNMSPFQSVYIDDQELFCEILLRSLPGKRLVYKGKWQKLDVIIKLFLDSKSARRHWAREKFGVESLKTAHIPTPELLYAGQLTDATPVLVFALLPDAQTALEAWNDLGSATLKHDFLCQLTELIGDLHASGLLQRDLHLDNFLVSGQQMFVIDGDAISVRGDRQAFGLKSSIDNLALCFAQLSPQDDHLMEPAVQSYAKRRNMDGLQLLAGLKTELPKARRKRRHNYVSKSYRTCSEFVQSKTARQFNVSRRDEQGAILNRLFDDPEAFMRDGELLKDGKTSTVVRVQVDGRDWVVKSYNIKSVWHILSRCFRPTRAWISWGNAHRLKISGIATPRPVAMIEKRFGPLRSTGYYVCDFVDGPRALHFFKDSTQKPSMKECAAQKFVDLFELFKKLGIHHGDCKALNFLLVDNAPCVLDLDAMHEPFFQARFKTLFRADRDRFLLNWQSQPELLQWFDEHLPR